MKTKIMFIIPLVAVVISSYDSNAQELNAAIAGVSAGAVTMQQLLSDSMLRVTEPGYVVVVFTLSVYTKNYDPVELKSNNAYLTALMREAISHSKEGSK